MTTVIAKKGQRETALANVLRGMASRMKVEIKGGRSFAALLAVVAAAAVLLERRQRREDKNKESRRWSSHPLVTWLLENSAVISVSVFANGLLSPPSQNFLSVFSKALINNIVQVWASMSLQGLYTHGIYGHLPHFSDEGRPHTSFPSLVKDYVQCLVPQQLFTVSLVALAFAKAPQHQFAKDFQMKAAISPVSFLFKYAIMRFFVDIGFWGGHRVLHHKSFYWIHRYHHTHYKPVLGTNYHFSPIDIFVEAAFPVMLGLGFLEGFGVQTTQLEKTLMVGYVGWHEQGSHCGKRLPTITFFPPLAPLYQLLLGNVDHNNIRHHDLHHNILNCNYGITIWPDIVMGTRHADPEEKALA